MKKEPKWTEKKWRLCADPSDMLHFLGKAATARKVRLFICACCRRAWHFAKNKKLKPLLPLVEDFADRKNVTNREREQALELARSVGHGRLNSQQRCLGIELRGPIGKKYLGAGFDTSAAGRLGEFAACAFGWAVEGSEFTKAKKAERKMQTVLVRDIFGNPFRPVVFKVEWRTTDVMLLAKGIYQEHAFDRMPILADALQDAGCDSDDMLTHLRDTTTAHYRGCWVLDLVLGKE